MSWFESKAGQNILVSLWSPYGIEQTIIFLPCRLFFFILFSLPTLSHRMRMGCLPYFHAWCHLSANLECRSEMCCTRLAGNEKSPKIRHLGTMAQLCRAISSQLRHLSSIGKKLVKQQYLLHMSLQYGKLRRTNG